MKLRKTAKSKIVSKQTIVRSHNRYNAAREETEEPNALPNDGDDGASVCLSLSGADEFWLPDDNPKRQKCIEAWEGKCEDKSHTTRTS